MSSVQNIFASTRTCKPFSRPECCIFCSFHRIWKHGTYSRTATYSKEFKNPPEEQIVQRYHCQNPPCMRTFAVLPADTLPYCRFQFSDALLIQQLSDSGLTAYATWKHCPLQIVSLAAIMRLFSFLKRVLTFLQQWCSESDIPIASGLHGLCNRVFPRHTWFAFTTRLYHAFYPKRLWAE